MWTGAAILLLLVLVLLSIPITLQFIVSWPATGGNDIRLGWAFGLVRVRVAPGETKPAEPGQRQHKPRQGGKPKRSSKAKRNLLAVLKESKVRRRAIRFVNDLWRAVHKDKVRLCARVGLGDPADTGQLWAFLGPVAGVLSTVESASIVVQPEFLDPVLDVDARGRIRVIPLQMIGLVLALPFSPAFWLAMRRLRSTG